MDRHDRGSQHACSASPHVDDLTASVAVLVAIQDDITVSSIELTIGRRVHGNLLRAFDPPNLRTETDLFVKPGGSVATDVTAFKRRSLSKIKNPKVGKQLKYHLV